MSQQLFTHHLSSPRLPFPLSSSSSLSGWKMPLLSDLFLQAEWIHFSQSNANDLNITFISTITRGSLLTSLTITPKSSFQPKNGQFYFSSDNLILAVANLLSIKASKTMDDYWLRTVSGNLWPDSSSWMGFMGSAEIDILINILQSTFDHMNTQS